MPLHIKPFEDIVKEELLHVLNSNCYFLCWRSADMFLSISVKMGNMTLDGSNWWLSDNRWYHTGKLPSPLTDQYM